MERILTDKIVEEVLNMRLPSTSKFQKCSYIMPNGKYLIMEEHYEAMKFLVVEELVQCIPDAEQLLSDLGFIRYSWIGYLTLPDRQLSAIQYETLEEALINISQYRDVISIQIQKNPKFFIDYKLDDIPYIIEKIKKFYKSGKLTI